MPYGDWGGTGDLWGVALTPSDVNSTNFGVGLAVKMNGDGSVNTTAYVDSVTMTVYYDTPAAGNIFGWQDNASVSSAATVSSATGDPTNGARSTVYQTYQESNPFTNSVAAIPSGSDGLWDFSIKSTAAEDGKTYCFRTVKANGSLLDNYTQIPEITYSSGGGGPTLEQKLRGGQSVVDGIKSPFSF